MKINNVFIVLLLITSCQKKKENQANLHSKEVVGFENITLIFEKAPVITMPESGESIHFSLWKKAYYFETIGLYRDDNGIIHSIDPRRTPNNDTTRISVNKKRLEIHFNEFKREGVAFLFSAGDTAKIRYNNGLIDIEILNRKAKLFDYKYNQLRYLQNDSISPIELFFHNYPRQKDGKKPRSPEYYNEVYLPKQAIVLEENLILQEKFLDSIFNNDLLSKDVYLYNQNKIKYTYWSMIAK